MASIRETVGQRAAGAGKQASGSNYVPQHRAAPGPAKPAATNQAARRTAHEAAWRARLARPPVWIGSLLALGALVWSYWPVAAKLVDAWNTEPDYSHGYLILPVALFLLWSCRDRLPAPSDRLHLGGLMLLGASVAIRLAGSIWYVNAAQAWSLLIWIAGACWLFGGRPLARWTLPAAAFLAFMIPLPFRAESLLSLPLQRVATQLSCWLLQSLGRPAVAEGNVIYLNEIELGVAEACSGLRIFISILALAYAFVALARRPWWMQAMLLASVLPVALAANATRIVATGLLYERVSSEAAHRFSHDLAGWLMAPLAAGMFGLVSWLLGRLLIQVAIASPGELMLQRPAAGEAGKRPTVYCRKLNVGFLTFVLFACAALATAGHFWHAYQEDRNAAALLTRADQNEKRRQWREAAQTIRRFLQLRPENADAQVRLAEDFDHIARTPREKRRAVELYAAAIGAAPQRTDLRSRHLTLVLEAGDHLAALKYADELLKREPQAAVGLRVRALALATELQARGDVTPKAVAAALELAIDFNPEDAMLATNLARLYRGYLQASEKADGVMDRLVLLCADQTPALLARHDYRRQFGLAGADDDLQRALKNDPKAENQSVRWTAALRAEEAADWPSAEQYYRDVVRLAPENRRGYLGLGTAQSEQGKLDEALETWHRGLSKIGGGDLTLLTRIAGAEIARRRWKAADKTLENIERQARDAFGREQSAAWAALYSLRAEMQIAREEFAQAMPLLNKAIVLHQTHGETAARFAADASLYGKLALCQGKLGQWDQAGVNYQKAADLQPSEASLRLSAAAAWAMTGRFDAAASQYELALARGDAPASAWVSYVGLVFRQQLAAPEPDWAEFDRILSEAQSALAADGPQSAGCLTLKLFGAKSLLERRQPDQAFELLNEIEREAGDDAEVAASLAIDYERLGRRQDADRALARLEKLPDCGFKAILLRVDLLAGRSQFDEAERLLSKALATRTSGAEQWELFQRRGLLLRSQGKVDLARRQFEELARIAPDDRRTVALLAELALERGDNREAQALESRLRELCGDEDALWRYYRAQRLLNDLAELPAGEGDARRRLFAEATKLQQKIEILRPQWGAAHLLKARLAQLATPPDVEEAIRGYVEALRLGETQVKVYQALVSLLYQQNRLAEAASYLNQLRSATDLPREISSLALAIDVRQGHLARALAEARRETQRRPDDALSHVWLGELLSLDSPADEKTIQSNRAEAEAELKKARDLAPADLRTWSALLTFYAGTKQPERARRLLEELDSGGFVASERRPFVLAQGYALAGDRERAKALYQEAAQTNRDSPNVQLQAAHYFWQTDPELAKPLVDRVLELEPGHRAANQLAALLRFREGGSEQELEQVYALLDHSGADAADLADQRLKALLLLKRGGASARSRARRILEGLLEGHSPGEIDRLLLAQLYEAEGDAAAAGRQWRALTESDARSANHWAGYAEFLLRTGQAAEAGAAIEQLAALESADRSWRTVSLEARWHKARGDVSQVSALVARFLESMTARTPDALQQSILWLNAGELYSLVALEQEAENAYRQAVRLEPANLPALAIWLARHGKADEAVRSCLAAAPLDATPQTASTISSLLHLAPVSEELRTAAESVLAAALERHSQDAQLLFDAATLRLFQGKNQEAVRLFRRTLQLDPRNLLAMNNLAMLLAAEPQGRAEALANIDRALAIAGSEPELLDSKAWILLCQGAAQQAETLLREAISARSGDPRHYFHLALACQLQGRLDEARNSLDKALELGLAVNLLMPEESSRLAALKQAIR